jgi:hypothetical protein
MTFNEYCNSVRKDIDDYEKKAAELHRLAPNDFVDPDEDVLTQKDCEMIIRHLNFILATPASLEVRRKA